MRTKPALMILYRLIGKYFQRWGILGTLKKPPHSIIWIMTEVLRRQNRKRTQGGNREGSVS